jgi:hypothetical protein
LIRFYRNPDHAINKATTTTIKSFISKQVGVGLEMKPHEPKKKNKTRVKKEEKNKGQ